MLLRILSPIKLRRCLALATLYTWSLTYTEGFDCSHLDLDGVKFDLSSLDSEFTLDIPEPDNAASSSTQSFHLAICNGLPSPPSNEPLSDTCESGTRVCETVINHKNSETDRVIAVRSYGENKADPTLTLERPGNTLRLEWSTTDGWKLKIYFECDKDGEPRNGLGLRKSDLNLKLYEVNWKCPAACPQGGTPQPPRGPNNGAPPPPDEFKQPETPEIGARVAGGIWRVILGLVILGSLLYLLLGIMYKRTVQNERGLDQIPHLEFWRSLLFKIVTCGSEVMESSRGFINGQSSGSSAVAYERI